jgi:transposase InsO family protein
VAVEHWNAECVGWHVCKRGTRFAALEPISQGLVPTVGSVTADARRGLPLWMDHGTQYLWDHFQNQLKHWGIKPSFAYIEQPQTNGVAECFIRSIKEQVIYGPGASESSGGEGGGQALCGHLQPRVASGGNRLQKPLAGWGPVARPSLTRKGGLIKACVQKTGCDTNTERLFDSTAETGRWYDQLNRRLQHEIQP